MSAQDFYEKVTAAQRQTPGPWLFIFSGAQAPTQFATCPPLDQALGVGGLVAGLSKENMGAPNALQRIQFRQPYVLCSGSGTEHRSQPPKNAQISSVCTTISSSRSCLNG